MPCGNPRCALSDKINDLRESFGRAERDRLPGFENKFLDCLRVDGVNICKKWSWELLQEL